MPAQLVPIRNDELATELEDLSKGKVPKLLEHTQFPLTAFLEWDKLHAVRSVIREFRQGQFARAALLVDQMSEDDRIGGDLETRIDGLLGCPMEMVPARGNRKAKVIAKATEKSWPRMMPRSSAKDIIHWGLFLGVGIGENVWQTEKEMWVPRVKTWHPQFLWWDQAKDTLVLQTQEGMIDLPQVDKHIHSDGKWIIYTPYGFRYGWRRALLPRLVVPWLIRQWAYMDWGRYNEVHGKPIRKAIVPGGGELLDKKDFTRRVTNLGSEAVIECAQGDAGNQYNVELIEAMGDSHGSFDMVIERCERAASITICGQDATGKAQGGSLANFKGEIRQDKRELDNENFGEKTCDQLLYWHTLYNYGDGDLAPRPTHQVEPPEDKAQKATSYLALAQGLPALEAAGADVRQILEDFEVPVKVLPALAKALPVTGAEPEEDEPREDYEAKIKAKIAAQFAAPSRQAAARMSLAGGDPSAPKSERAYEDELVRDAMAAGRQALNVDLARLKKVIDGSRDFADCKAKLAEEFKDFDPERLARLVMRARTLANMQGRKRVLEE